MVFKKKTFETASRFFVKDWCLFGQEINFCVS